ncbi:sulfurtransferase complex subunit TusD [Colwellia sp. MEBiC06753]
MVTFSLVITTAPHQNNTATAIEFAKAVLAQGHQINGIFFYQNGVLHANTLVKIPSDEFQAIEHFLALNAEHHIPLYLCITAAEKRGLSDEDGSPNISQQFTISGLGEMVELTSSADKVVQW